VRDGSTSRVIVTERGPLPAIVPRFQVTMPESGLYVPLSLQLIKLIPAGSISWSVVLRASPSDILVREIV